MDKHPKTENESIHYRFTAYVVRALRNCKNEYIGKQQLDQHLSLDEMMTQYNLDEALVNNEDTLELVLQKHALEEIISNDGLLKGILRLSDRERRVMNLYLVQKMKLQEVADFLGISYNSVKWTYYNAMEKLRKYMGV